MFKMFKIRATLTVNCQGHYKFLKSAVESGIKEIICIGTCFEYGGISAPYKSSDVTKPNTKYGIAKDCLRKKNRVIKIIL